MSMTQERFAELVAHYDQQARQHPLRYKLQIFLLALLGYAYLGLLAILTLLLLMVCIASLLALKLLAIKLIIPVGAFLWVMMRALWVRLPEPEGITVSREQAPELFALVDRVRKKLKAPRFHRVLLVSDFNAAVVQIPRLGALGWHRNYLLIGLPLLQGLTVAQFEAVLAHEFGHLSGGHARVGNWIYRLRVSWMRLLVELERANHRGLFLVKPFFNWFAPYFHACSFPLARLNEYQADAVAAGEVSSRALAGALSRVAVLGAYLEERFWPGVYERADASPEPVFAPYSDLTSHLVDLNAEDARLWLDRHLAQATGVDDTHPCLMDRLRAIGEIAQWEPPRIGAGAEQLLGSAAEPLTRVLNERWQERIGHAWRERFHTVQQSKQQLAELDGRAQEGEELPLQDAYQRALLCEIFGAGPDVALEQLQSLRGRAPHDPAIGYALGQRLLGRNDASGVELIKWAIGRDEEFSVPGCQLLRDYFWSCGNQAEAENWHNRWQENAAMIEEARAERASVHPRDSFGPHLLETEQVRKLVEQIAGLGTVQRAFLVRKQVRFLSRRPLYVLGYTLKWHLGGRKKTAELREQIRTGIVFPHEAFVVDLGQHRTFEEALKAVPGSRIC